MRISRLRIRDVKRHQKLDLELAPGVTVIKGPNEAGKTTVQRAIELALFRRVTSAGQEMDGVRRWGARGDANPLIEVDFEVEGVAGRLQKTFAGAKGRVELRFDGQVLTDPAAVDQRLAELTGVPSEKFFRSTASVRHQELTGLATDEGALRDRLQLSMSGADRGTSAAKKKLQDALHRYETAGVKNPGILKSARESAQRLETEVARGESELVRLGRDRQALAEAHGALDRAERQLAEDRHQLAESERAVKLLERQTVAQTAYERYKRLVELREQIAQLDAKHPSKIALPVLRTGVERLRGQERTISQLRAELASEPDVSSYDIAISSPKWQRWAVLAIVLAIAGFFVALGGAATAVGPNGTIIGLALVGAALLCIFYALRQRALGSDVRRQNLLRDAEISRRLSGRSNLEQELKDTERARDEQLKSLEFLDVPSAEQMLEAETAHVASIDALKGEYRGVLGDEQPKDDVARLRDAAAAEADQSKHALSGMGEIGQDPVRSRDRFAAAVAAGQGARDRAMSDAAQAKARVDQNPVDAEAVAAQVERLAEERERLAAHERRVRVLRGALDALEAAEQATMKKAARYLEKRMADDVALITGGRYRRVKVDENELTFTVWSAERGDWVDVSQLSYGTLDQFYLAARLGLVRQVTQDRRPPLIFDDPFVTFDDARAERALELLKRLASDHQVIYLTCSSRYDSVADKVIELPRPTELDPAPELAAPAVAG
jgi:DNA repair exonuclease SbcCD ATPase subunit